MTAILIIVAAIILLLIGYVGYGSWLAKQWGIDPKKSTPAVEMEDGVDYKLPILQQEKSDFIENEVKLQIKEKSKNEYYRLLYVAMTRAENELYICDIENSSTPNEENWYSLIKRAVENMNPQKKTDINFKDAEILYIGEDDIFEKKEENAKNEKENLKVDEIIKILSKEIKESNETKIINPIFANSLG